jgi:hypothetical protein
VTAKIAYILTRVRRKYVDSVAVNSCKQMTTVAESRFFASLDRKFFEGPNVVHQHIEHSQLVTETDQQMQTRGMERDALSFFIEVLR